MHSLADPETSKGGANFACGSSPWPRSGYPGREAATPMARGSGGALKLPQGVRAEPGRQTFLMHLWPENEVWERLKNLNRLLAELGVGRVKTGGRPNLVHKKMFSVRRRAKTGGAKLCTHYIFSLRGTAKTGVGPNLVHKIFFPSEGGPRPRTRLGQTW